MARNFLWDPIEDNVIAEFDDDGGLIVEYTTEPELYGDVISQRRDGETNCFYSDGLGSTTEVTNATGDTIATRAYSVFGETTETSGDLIFPYQFVGQKGYYRDAEIGEYYVRQRAYLPMACRWRSPDPLLGYVGFERFIDSVEASLYLYSQNSPACASDPSGLWTSLTLNVPTKRFGLPPPTLAAVAKRPSRSTPAPTCLSRVLRSRETLLGK